MGMLGLFYGVVGWGVSIAIIMYIRRLSKANIVK